VVTATPAIAVDFAVYDKRPNDSYLLIPAIEIRAPYLVAADLAFYSGKNEVGLARRLQRLQSRKVPQANQRKEYPRPAFAGDARGALKRNDGGGFRAWCLWLIVQSLMACLRILAVFCFAELRNGRSD
jgi:hypothetical protein